MNSITKVCPECNKEKAKSDFCKDSKAKDGLRRICRDCTGKREKRRYSDFSDERKEKIKVYHRELRNKTRIKIIDTYGGKCACCGETNHKFLAIDHKYGNGNKMRREKVHPKGPGFYFWLMRNNYPDDFQILCHNCNMAKAFYGKCPHEGG